MNFISVGRRLFLLSVLAVAVGCGQNGLSTLTGVVTIDGQPAPQGIGLEFTPVFEGGSPAYGQTDAQGRYEALFTFDTKGIMPGEHIVKLLPGFNSEAMPEVGPDGKPVKTAASKNPLSEMPKTYWEEIEKIEIKAGRNNHEIALKSK